MRIDSYRSNCERCVQLPLCEGTADADQIAGHRLRVRRHDSLYRAGESPGNRIYSIRSGSFKMVMTRADGEEQVTGFAMAPEFLGLNTLGAAGHNASAVALEDSEVCVIDWDRQAFRGRRQPMQRLGLHALLAGEIRRAQHATLLLHHTHSRQRMADLMLSLSQAHRSNGYSALRFRLPMSRCDIASYIGVGAECVSRLLDQFRRQGLVQLQRRDLTLLDPDALQRAAAGVESGA